MQIIVGLTPIKVSANSAPIPIIQNLGPGIIYLDSDPEVSVASGLKLGLNMIYESPVTGSLTPIYLISDTENTDVRFLLVG